VRKYWRSDGELGLRFYVILLIGCWTLVVILSICWRISQESQVKIYLAHEIARSHLEKDLIIREWNMAHGFVYAPVTPEHQPNPLLKMPEKDIVTPSGKVFTAINSSTMIQQIYKMSGKKLSYQGHLTSLTPLRPENAPDHWEEQALKKLANGATEISDVVNKNGNFYFRLIRPITATD
jgi:two-component system, chemotaxis family, sensor kinase Cph1